MPLGNSNNSQDENARKPQKSIIKSYETQNIDSRRGSVAKMIPVAMRNGGAQAAKVHETFCEI